MTINANDILISDELDRDILREVFSRSSRLHIPSFLNKSSAEAIYSNLSKQKDWNLVFNNSGKHVDVDSRAVSLWPEHEKLALENRIFNQASTSFQYYYEAIPIYDIFHKKLLPGHYLNQLYEFVSSKRFIDFVKYVTSDNSISFVDAQVTKFSGNNFLTQHNDNVHGKHRRVAYVINLSKGWRPDWGGALQFFDESGNVESAFTPSFNALNLFRVPAQHSVGFVAPFALEPRLSITGWLRAGKDPMVK